MSLPTPAPKRLARPATIDVRAKPQFNVQPKIVRPVTLPKQTSGVEDFYAAVSSREQLQLSGYEWQRRAAVSNGIRAWFLVLAFWTAVVLLGGLWLAR
jgi:hypothetical protein